MHCAALACLLLLCTAVPLRGAEIAERFRVLSVPVKASALIGKQVRTGKGEHVGVLRDLVFDLEHNRVHHAVVGERRYPMHALEASGGHLVLELPHDPIAQRWPERRLLPAQQLFGARFAAGAVVDAVLDAFWGNVAFALVGTAEALRPVPLDAFHEEDGRLVLRVPDAALRDIDAFSLATLDAHLQDPDFLQRTARAAHQLTPLHGKSGNDRSGSGPE